MNEEFDAEDNLDFFNANFECDDENQIMDLYKIEKSIENNDNIAKKIQIGKYNHPLFLNYNYCLFCLERRKTKYNHYNLDSMHNKANIKTIGDFLEKNQINLKKPKNKIEKISKRRFIHSCDSIQNNNIEVNYHNESDTELYIESKDENYDYAISKNNSKKIKFAKKNANMNKAYLKKSSRQLSSKLSMEEKEKEKEKRLSIKNYKSGKIKRMDLYKSDNKNINNFLSKRNLTNFMPKRSNSIKNGERDDTILNLEKNSLKDKKKGKTFSLFGFISEHFNNSPENNSSNDIFKEDINDTDDISLQYYEKNEKCRICLDEIKDKFTLFCGDFFCRECIKNLIEESLNNIALFDKIECPRCHEPINDSTVKFFLTGEKLEKYNKIKMRIEGLKDKRNIPCPYPDCEGFALKEEEKNGILECQNGHIFCKKCSEIISQKHRRERKNTHSCRQKSENEKYLESNKDIKRCPQCNTWVQRDPGGCNYFQCSNIWCKFVFCWICGNKYDSSHYKNPLSMCFGLTSSDLKGKMIKSIKIRRIRCILIALLFILILLPIIFIFFSFFEIISFALYFQFDGKELRNVRFKSKMAHKIFYTLYKLFLIFISIALIPFGYISFVILLLAIPILIIINKCRKKKRYDF